MPYCWFFRNGFLVPQTPMHRPVIVIIIRKRLNENLFFAERTKNKYELKSQVIELANEASCAS